MPDHDRGYVRRKEGILATDLKMSTYYRRNLLHDPVIISREMQSLLINASLEAFKFQDLRGHYIATETTHLHLLVSWHSNATWQLVRRRLGSSLTRCLNREIERRPWFSKQPSRKHVREQQHFDYLLNSYLPKHSGLKWSEKQGRI